MDGDIPDAAAPDEAGLDNALAALDAIRDLRACRQQVGDLRNKFGACDAQRRVHDVSGCDRQTATEKTGSGCDGDEALALTEFAPMAIEAE